MVMVFVKLLVLISCAFTPVSTHGLSEFHDHGFGSSNDFHRLIRRLNELENQFMVLEEHVAELDKKIDTLTKSSKVGINKVEPLPMDCEDVRKQRQEATIESGLYLVQAPGLLKRRIYCRFDKQATWTTISRRIHEEDIFNKTWNEYKNGFGKATGDYWIGNEMIYQLTSRNDYYLRITMDTGLRGTKTSSYKSFRIGSEAYQYRLLLGAYDSVNSDGGDSFFPRAACNKNNAKDAPFSTYDRGNAMACSQKFSGGWWFTNCGCSNLNGKYVLGLSVPTDGPNIGLYWQTLYIDQFGLKSSLRSVTLEIRRIKNNKSGR